MGNRVSAAETRITQTENSIKLKADQTTVNGINSRLQSAEAKITPDAIRLTVKDQATQLANTAANNAVNGLQIGGRNLARGTSNEWRSFPITNGVNICWNGYGGSVYIDGEKISTNDTIIVSFDVKYSNMKKQALGSGEAYRCILQGSGNVTGWSSGIPGCDLLSQINFSTGTGEFHVSYSFKLNSTQLTNTRFDTNIRHDRLTGTLSVRNFKAEKGNKATNWSGAPEDYSTTEQIKSQFTIDANGISMLGKKISLAGMVTFSSLNSDVQSKINTALDRKIGLAQMDTTVISGGYIKTSLINTDELVAKKVSALEGTFKKLTAYTGKGVISLNGSGVSIEGDQSWIYGDMYSQGPSPVRPGYSNRYYASDIFCRGLLGFNSLAVAVIVGSYIRYYDRGYSYEKRNTYTQVQMSSSNGMYIIPLYCTTGTASGFAANVVLFDAGYGAYKYQFESSPGKLVIAVNVNDKANGSNIQIAEHSTLYNLEGGHAKIFLNIGYWIARNPTMSASHASAGWITAAALSDNNW